MVDGLASAQVRIAEIQRQMAAMSQSSVTSSPSVQRPADAKSVADFASILRNAKSASAVDPTKYPNGKLPDEALVSIGGGEKLVGPAAESFLRLQSKAKTAGVSFDVNDSYRSFDEQVDMAKRKGLYSQGGLAAKPGTSTHGLGLSVDLELDAKAQQWMKTNAKQFGWVNDVKGEPWHWTFKP